MQSFNNIVCLIILEKLFFQGVGVYFIASKILLISLASSNKSIILSNNLSSIVAIVTLKNGELIDFMHGILFGFVN